MLNAITIEIKVHLGILKWKKKYNGKYMMAER
jgi:hypothetical protein